MSFHLVILRHCVQTLFLNVLLSFLLVAFRLSALVFFPLNSYLTHTQVHSCFARWHTNTHSQTNKQAETWRNKQNEKRRLNSEHGNEIPHTVGRQRENALRSIFTFCFVFLFLSPGEPQDRHSPKTDRQVLREGRGREEGLFACESVPNATTTAPSL